MQQRKNYPYEIKAFAAFLNRGHFIYATIKPSAEEALASYRHYNSEVPNHYFEILSVYIGIDKGFQYDLEEAIKN